MICPFNHEDCKVLCLACTPLGMHEIDEPTIHNSITDNMIDNQPSDAIEFLEPGEDKLSLREKIMLSTDDDTDRLIPIHTKEYIGPAESC